MSDPGDQAPSASLRRRAAIFQHGVLAGCLEEVEGGRWRFTYREGYEGPVVSLTLPRRLEPYEFSGFPAVFEGLLPEGPQLEALLRMHKIDRSDAFRQLVTVGSDLVGSLTVEEIASEPEWTPKESAAPCPSAH